VKNTESVTKFDLFYIPLCTNYAVDDHKTTYKRINIFLLDKSSKFVSSTSCAWSTD